MYKENAAFQMNAPGVNLAGMNYDTRATITIRLKPYLQEYLRCKLRDAELMAGKRNLIGTMLRPFLQIGIKDHSPTFHHNDVNWITFNLPVYDDLEVRRHSVMISEDNMKYFEDILENHFKDLFFSFMDDKVRYMSVDGKRGAIKKCIIQFCADINISFNCINYEMLKKSYYRRRKEMNKKRSLFAGKLSFTGPLIFLL